MLSMRDSGIGIVSSTRGTILSAEWSRPDPAGVHGGASRAGKQEERASGVVTARYSGELEIPGPAQAGSDRDAVSSSAAQRSTT